jgi:hypothetical protein
MSHFVWDLTMVRDIYGLKAMVLKIKEKSDPFPLPLIIWANDEFPELCPVRHLLMSIALTGVQSGYIFGKPYEFNSRNAENYPYEEFLARLNEICVGFLKRPLHGNIYDTHVLRKTGYLFAIFGFLKRYEPEFCSKINKHVLPKMAMGAIMKSARYAAVCNAVTYMRDSMALYEWVKAALKMDDHGVAVFKDIHVEGSPLFKSVLGEEVHFFQKESIFEMATWYVCTYLQLKNDSNLSVEGALQVPAA